MSSKTTVREHTTLVRSVRVSDFNIVYLLYCCMLRWEEMRQLQGVIVVALMITYEWSDW